MQKFACIVEISTKVTQLATFYTRPLYQLYINCSNVCYWHASTGKVKSWNTLTTAPNGLIKFIIIIIIIIFVYL